MTEIGKKHIMRDMVVLRVDIMINVRQDIGPVDFHDTLRNQVYQVEGLGGKKIYYEKSKINGKRFNENCKKNN